MLFTRCPDCDTTFRITADALSKADGQVRCGRCACVFNAYSELREQRNGAAETEQPTAPEGRDEDSDVVERAAVEGTIGEPTETPASAPASAPTEAPRVEPTVDPGNGADFTSSPEEEIASSHPAAIPVNENFRMASAAPPALLPPSSAPNQDVTFGDFTVASIIEQIESSAVDDGEDKHDAFVALTPGDLAPLDKPQVDSMSPDVMHSLPPRAWELIPEPRTAGAARRWLLGSAVAGVLLALQMTHHFRAEIADVALVGPLLQGTYALLGGEVVPRWRLEQYQIVDWIATAEPNASGEGSLKITARIHNKGPQAQPYPHVQVLLNDRWEKRIGHRVFEPSQYLNDSAHPGALMAPGAIARAELEVVDPGPEAYGFELDVCVQGEAKTLRCSADAVFRSL